jgi:AcrR family transcriptional regulator
VPKPSPTQPRSKERVEAIFEATRVLLREGGVERCTVAAIAAQAEISPASLYRYFPDATSIIRALAEASLDTVHEALKALLNDIDSPEAIEPTLKRALDAYFDYFAGDRALRELWFGTLADPELVALNTADSQRNGELFAASLAPYVDLPIGRLRDRWFLLSHMIGASVGLCLDVPPAQSKRLRRELASLISLVTEL